MKLDVFSPPAVTFVAGCPSLRSSHPPMHSNAFCPS